MRAAGSHVVSFYPPQVSTGRHSSTASRSSPAGNPTGKEELRRFLLLARLGLRACEIVALGLDDIDWDNGRITIHGKGGRVAQMPLPCDIGEAIASYLRFGRPCCTCRRVFLRHRAPLRGFADSTTVSSIVRRALIDAGVDSARKGAHLFRHTLAQGVLEATGNIKVAQEILGHSHLSTTADLYLRVDQHAMVTALAAAKSSTERATRQHSWPSAKGAQYVFDYDDETISELERTIAQASGVEPSGGDS